MLSVEREHSAGGPLESGYALNVSLFLKLFHATTIAISIEVVPLSHVRINTR